MQGIFSTLARLGRLLGAPRRLLGSGVGNLRSVFQILVAAGFCWFVASSLWIYPHSLSYANELIGGPFNLPKHLLGSSGGDWGQDLRYLKTIPQHAKPAKLHLAFSGSFAPQFIGFSNWFPIEKRVSRRDAVFHQTVLTPGWYAISRNLIHGTGQIAYDGNTDTPATLSRFTVKQLSALSSNEIASAGYSIAILRVHGCGEITDRAENGFVVDDQESGLLYK